MTDTHTNVLVRMTNEMKAALQKHAKVNETTLTAEILSRLRISLGANGPTLQGILAREAEAKKHPPSYSATPTPALTANDNGPAPALTDLDRAMLRVFHSMPVEKQLALLSLFR